MKIVILHGQNHKGRKKTRSVPFLSFLQEEKSIDAVNKIDITKYKDSMLPLIQKDINELMKVLKTY